jgi:N-acetylmuramic acid 6-phosphate etherase
MPTPQSESVAEAEVGLADVVIGVAASGRTPFTLAAVRAAAGSGALTVALAGSSGSPLLEAAAHPLLVETGAEVLAGSTRMKAGTAQKIALNTLSTAIMMRLGHVHDGLMVGMRPTNGKLRRRAAEMVARIADVEPERRRRRSNAPAGGSSLRCSLRAGCRLARAPSFLPRRVTICARPSRGSDLALSGCRRTAARSRKRGARRPRPPRTRCDASPASGGHAPRAA